MKIRYLLAGLAIAALATGLYLASQHPPDAVQGEFVRIINVHVPASWVAFIAFGGTLLGSLGWLVTKRDRLDAFAAASAEVGVFFTALSLVSGMIWGQVTWGIAWDWGDARMASTALMFFIYLGYLGLRRGMTAGPERAKRSAVVGALGFLTVPLTYFSVNLFRSLHQTQSVRPDGWQIESGEIIVSMLVNVAAYSIVYLLFVSWRTGQELAEARIEVDDEALAGDAIEAAQVVLQDGREQRFAGAAGERALEGDRLP